MSKTVAKARAWTWRMGDVEVTALSDGYLMLPRSSLMTDPQAGPVELGAHHGPPSDGQLRLDVNAFLVRSEGRTVLIDTGASNSWDDTMGALPESLRLLKVEQEDITDIALTHTHRDHLNGLLSDTGDPAYPKLERLFVGAAEQDRILDRDDLAFYHTVLTPIADGDEISPRVTAVAAPGHSPGHTCFEVNSGRDTLLIWGDIVHVADIQFAQPRVAWQYDEDRECAVETRLRLLERVASGGHVAAGAHIDFPGIRRVRVADGAYSAESVAANQQN